MPTETPPLEEMLSSPDWFGITELSPVQRAICRVIDGLSLGELAADPLVVAMFVPGVAVEAWKALLWGTDAEKSAAAAALDRSGIDAWERLAATAPPGWRPTHVVMPCGVRALKTVIAVAAAVRGSCLCDMSPAAADEELPRTSFLSVYRDLAKSAYSKFAKAVQRSPRLQAMAVSEVSQASTIVERPDGNFFEVKITTADEGGASLISRWVSTAVFDEGARFGGSETKQDYAEIEQVARERLLPGGQLLTPGAPWAAIGPVYDLVRDRLGRPGRDCVVLMAPTAAMWPAWWTRERIEEQETIARSKGTFDLYLASFWCVFIENADVVLIPSSWIVAAQRATDGDIPPARRPWPAVAAMDPATRSNAWTLTIVARDTTQRLRTVLARQWKPETGRPLDPDVVLGEVAVECARYGLNTVYSDQLAADWNASIARKHGLIVVERRLQGDVRYQAYQTLRGLLSPGQLDADGKPRSPSDRLELPQDNALADDLRRVRRKLTQTGVTVDLQKTQDGRHCDYASALVLCAINPPPAWQPEPRVRAEHEELDGFDGEADPLDYAVDIDALDRRRERQRFIDGQR